jgi:acyl carrier protein
MDKNEILKIIKRIITEKFDTDKEMLAKVNDNTKLDADLGLDSLDGFELLYAIEEELDIELSYELAVSWHTVGEVMDIVHSVVNGKRKLCTNSNFTGLKSAQITAEI